MIKSIQQFQSNGVKNLEKIMVDYSSDMTKIAEMVQGVTKGVVNLGLSIIAEEWESYDEMLRDRKELRSEWYIVRRDETTLITRPYLKISLPANMSIFWTGLWG